MKKLQGVSLAEVLVSLFILSLALLGFDAMEISAMRANQSAYFFNLAENQFKEISERLRAVGNNNEVNDQIAIWNLHNAEVLPQGRGEVKGHYPDYKIFIFWGGMKGCEKTTVMQTGCLMGEIGL